MSWIDETDVNGWTRQYTNHVTLLMDAPNDDLRVQSNRIYLPNMDRRVRYRSIIVPRGTKNVLIRGVETTGAGYYGNSNLAALFFDTHTGNEHTEYVVVEDCVLRNAKHGIAMGVGKGHVMQHIRLRRNIICDIWCDPEFDKPQGVWFKNWHQEDGARAEDIGIISNDIWYVHFGKYDFYWDRAHGIYASRADTNCTGLFMVDTAIAACAFHPMTGRGWLISDCLFMNNPVGGYWPRCSLEQCMWLYGNGELVHTGMPPHATDERFARGPDGGATGSCIQAFAPAVQDAEDIKRSLRRSDGNVIYDWGRVGSTPDVPANLNGIRDIGWRNHIWMDRPLGQWDAARRPTALYRRIMGEGAPGPVEPQDPDAGMMPLERRVQSLEEWRDMHKTAGHHHFKQTIIDIADARIAAAFERGKP